MSAAPLGLLLCVSAHTTPAAATGSIDALRIDAPLYRYFRDALGGASVADERAADFDKLHSLTDDLAHVCFDSEAAQPAGATAGATACVRGRARGLTTQYRPVAGLVPRASALIETSVSDLVGRFPYTFGRNLRLASDSARQDEREVLLKNADAFVRAKARLTLSKEWAGFVYADMGAADSALRWQGLAGIHGSHGVDLLGGWRHVTYHFSPGRGFDSLDFDGPFLGATLAW